MVKALRSKLENIDQHIKEVRARRRQIVKLLKEMGDWAPSWAAAGGAASPRRYSAWCVAEVTGRPWSFSGSPNSCSDHSQSWRLSRRINAACSQSMRSDRLCLLGVARTWGLGRIGAVDRHAGAGETCLLARQIGDQPRDLARLAHPAQRDERQYAFGYAPWSCRSWSGQAGCCWRWRPVAPAQSPRPSPTRHRGLRHRVDARKPTRTATLLPIVMIDPRQAWDTGVDDESVQPAKPR